MKAAQPIRPLSLDMNTHDRLCLLGLSHVEFLRPREKLFLVQSLGGASRLFSLSLADIARMIGRRLSTSQWKPDQILSAAEGTQKSLTDGCAESIFYWDSTYPPQLREIFDPPVTLFLRGTLPDSGVPLAGVVGTRFPTGAARQAAFRLGFDLGREGISVVSGLARGIDTDAHEGCVEAGGRSVAVLGNGIDQVYPVSSRATGAVILARGGAIVSEYPPAVPPLSYHFPARNRIISGLCRSVVVVQAPERSGALITAEYALDQGRDLWVHAAGISGSAGAGTARLADSGAPVIEGAADLLHDWGMSARSSQLPCTEEHGSEGERLAQMVRHEIEGACAFRGGETYWRA
jgi:DNA processing protein